MIWLPELMDESSDQNVVSCSFATLQNLPHTPNISQIVMVSDDIDVYQQETMVR